MQTRGAVEQYASPRWRRRPFPLRVAGVMTSAWLLLALPAPAAAATVDQTVPASQQSCLRSMLALIRDARGSATHIQVSSPSPTSRIARIFVADGEVRIICEASSHQMTIIRVLDAADDGPAELLVLNTQQQGITKE